MNKLSLALLLAAGLFVIDASPAEAHSGVDRVHVKSYGHPRAVLRSHEMPGYFDAGVNVKHYSYPRMCTSSNGARAKASERRRPPPPSLGIR